MRVTVIGGHGRTGLLLVQQLLAAQHTVVATIRNPKHMAELVEIGAETVMLDLDKSKLEDIVSAVTGSDAVIFAAGSAEGEGSALDRKGTLRTVRATEKAGVRRYIAISTIGASTGMSTRSMNDEMKDYYRQKRAAAKHITGSTLDWTIIEPAELTEDKPSGKVNAGVERIEETAITRADVAAFVIATLDEPRAIGQAIQLAGGNTAIPAALKAALA